MMISDAFFIEEVYTSSSLKNTSIYYLVDYFDDEIARKILIEEGLSKEDVEYVVNMAGGVPWIMAEVTSNGDPKEKVRMLYKQTSSKVFEAIRGREDLKKLLKRALNGENLYYEERDI